MFSQVFCTVLVHRKCISKMYYRSRGWFSLFFPSLFFSLLFGSVLLFQTFCTYKWFFVWFRSIFSVSIFIRAAAYLPSAFLWVFFAIALPLWLYIYLFIFLLVRNFVPCQSFSSFAFLFSLSIHFTVWIELSFSLFARKNIRCYMRSHYSLRRHHIFCPVDFFLSFFCTLQIVYVDCAGVFIFCHTSENYSYICS